MTAKRVKILLVAWESDRTGPAGDLLLLLPRFPADRLAATVVFRHEAGPLALELQHAGAMVLDLGIGEAERAKGLVATLAAVHRLVRIMRELVPASPTGSTSHLRRSWRSRGAMAGVPVLVGTSRAPGARGPAGFAARQSAGWTMSSWRQSRSGRVHAGRPAGLIRRRRSLARRDRSRGGRGAAPLARLLRAKASAGDDAAPGRAGRDPERDRRAAKILRGPLPDLEWLVAGIGSDGVRCLRLVQGEGLEACMKLLGDREDVGGDPGFDRRLRRSRRRPDALPPGLLKALAAGVPCIAARNPALEAAFVARRDLFFVARGRPGGLASGDRASPRGLRGAAPRAPPGFRARRGARISTRKRPLRPWWISMNLDVRAPRVDPGIIFRPPWTNPTASSSGSKRSTAGCR